MISVGILVIVAIVSWWRSSAGLALAVHGYLISSALDVGEVSVASATTSTASRVVEDNLMLGAGLPGVVFGIIALKSLGSWQRYRIHLLDVVLLALGALLLFGSLHSPEPLLGVETAARYFALGAGFYFFARGAFITSSAEDAKEQLNSFLVTTWALAIGLGVLATYFGYEAGYGGHLPRLTLGSAHPIPFSLLISMALLINVFWISGYRSYKLPYLLLYASAAFLGLVLIASNTRGTVLAFAVAVAIMLAVEMSSRLSVKAFIRLGVALVIAGASIKIIAGDSDLINSFVERFSLLAAADSDESIAQRLSAYDSGWQMFSDNPLWGVGTAGFSSYGQIGYAHNLVMEIAAEQGIVGVVVLIVVLGVTLGRTAAALNIWRAQPLLLLFAALTVFNLIEAQFSFTLWMHKNLFLYLGLLVETLRATTVPAYKTSIGLFTQRSGSQRSTGASL